MIDPWEVVRRSEDGNEDVAGVLLGTFPADVQTLGGCSSTSFENTS